MSEEGVGEEAVAAEVRCPMVGGPCIENKCKFYMALLDRDRNLLRSECGIILLLSLGQEQAQLSAQVLRTLNYRGGHRG